MDKNIDSILENISHIKKTKEILKQRFMINGLKSMKIGIQKKGLSTTKDYLRNIKSIKEILDLLKILSSNQGKYDLVNELLVKGKNLMNLFPKKLKEKVFILKNFEEELNKYTNKSSENMQEQFQKLIMNYLIETFEVLPLKSLSVIFF